MWSSKVLIDIHLEMSSAANCALFLYPMSAVCFSDGIYDTLTHAIYFSYSLFAPCKEVFTENEALELFETIAARFTCDVRLTELGRVTRQTHFCLHMFKP